MMLKQICEIASQNTGFINSHFEEYIKNRGTQNGALSPTTAGLVNAKMNIGSEPRLEIKGREKAVSPLRDAN